MESNWATEHLQVIRTLMERAAIYRRALAPIMIFTGVVGTGAAVLGCVLKIDSPQIFIFYWAGVAVVALAGSFLLVRRQALKESEPFWSPPTRRVTQALLPPLVAGFIVTAIIMLNGPRKDMVAPVFGLVWLPLFWVILYGCAIHAAGFFMPRGIKIFGWALIIGGCGLLALGVPDQIPIRTYAYGVMGLFFGVLHLAYGVYLYFTEQRKNVA